MIKMSMLIMAETWKIDVSDHVNAKKNDNHDNDARVMMMMTTTIMMMLIDMQ